MAAETKTQFYNFYNQIDAQYVHLWVKMGIQ